MGWLLRPGYLSSPPARIPGAEVPTATIITMGCMSAKCRHLNSTRGLIMGYPRSLSDSFTPFLQHFRQAGSALCPAVWLARHFPHLDSDINDLPGEGIEEWGDNSAGISVNAELLASPVQEPTCLAPHAAVSPQTPSAIGVVIDYLCCLHRTVIKRP